MRFSCSTAKKYQSASPFVRLFSIRRWNLNLKSSPKLSFSLLFQLFLMHRAGVNVNEKFLLESRGSKDFYGEREECSQELLNRFHQLLNLCWCSFKLFCSRSEMVSILLLFYFCRCPSNKEERMWKWGLTLCPHRTGISISIGDFSICSRKKSLYKQINEAVRNVWCEIQISLCSVTLRAAWAVCLNDLFVEEELTWPNSLEPTVGYFFSLTVSLTAIRTLCTLCASQWATELWLAEYFANKFCLYAHCFCFCSLFHLIFDFSSPNAPFDHKFSFNDQPQKRSFTNHSLQTERSSAFVKFR